MRYYKITFLLLFLILSGFAAWAQPTVGQKFLTLRDFNFTAEEELNRSGTVSSIGSDVIFNLHLQAGMMLSENRSVGVGLISQVNSRSISVFEQTERLGVSAFVRQWFPLQNQFYLHADLYVSGSYAGRRTSDKSLHADLGLTPGMSWFFHPKWSLEGRLVGLQLNYRNRRTLFIENHTVSTFYNVNPLNMQFSISRFF